MKAYERGYLRARAEISADKDGDIFGQKRRYLPAKPHKGLTDKVHIVVRVRHMTVGKVAKQTKAL